ncbi:MAG: hypothetical protein V1682_05085 [Candidatus Omnitrophota bacterium]
MKNFNKIVVYSAAILIVCGLSAVVAFAQDDDNTKNVLKQGLLGAGVGAISSSTSGGNAGTGALVGAGTSVIGSALLDAITGPSSSSSSRRSAPAQQDDYYYADSPQDYYYEEEPPQESGTSKILKQGLLGAGTGAIASGVSGGDAGKGALIGAGTSVIGNALLDAITTPAPQRRKVYRRAPQPQQYPPQQGYQQQPYQAQPYQQQYQAQPYQQQYQPQAAAQAQNIKVSDEIIGSGEGKKRVIKKYDANGKLVSEEETYY